MLCNHRSFFLQFSHCISSGFLCMKPSRVKVAVKGLSLCVCEGEVFGLLVCIIKKEVDNFVDVSSTRMHHRSLQWINGNLNITGSQRCWQDNHYQHFDGRNHPNMSEPFSRRTFIICNYMFVCSWGRRDPRPPSEQWCHVDPLAAWLLPPVLSPVAQRIYRWDTASFCHVEGFSRWRNRPTGGVFPESNEDCAIPGSMGRKAVGWCVQLDN